MTNQLLAELEMANRKLEEKDKEIERLSKEVDMWNKKYNEQIDIINELEKDLWKIRQLTFSKYNSNEWNNCLSFNDDILPIIKRIKALKEGKENDK